MKGKGVFGKESRGQYVTSASQDKMPTDIRARYGRIVKRDVNATRFYHCNVIPASFMLSYMTRSPYLGPVRWLSRRRRFLPSLKT